MNSLRAVSRTSRLTLGRYFLSIATFCVLFFTINVIGYFGVQVLLRYVERVFINLQLDDNRREAEFLLRFITDRLKTSRDTTQVLHEVQAAIEGTEYNRGYSCVINTSDSRLLCHPDVTMLNVQFDNVSTRFQTISNSSDFSTASVKEWAEVIRGGGASGFLQLSHDENADREIVYMLKVPGTPWVVNSHENSARLNAEITALRSKVVYAALFCGILIAFPASFFARRISRIYERHIEQERARSEQLLLNILPVSIAERLKKGEQLIADKYDHVAVLFCDLVGFTVLSAHKTPEELLQMLNEIYSVFDEISSRHGIEKIKTIGDAYMVIGGAPERNIEALERVARASLEYCSAIATYRAKHQVSLSIRIGLHYGPLVAGVIGTTKFTYDVWGDTVNTASRMESHGSPDRVHCSEHVFEHLHKQFDFEDRGLIEVKGKGTMHTYLLLVKKRSSAV